MTPPLFHPNFGDAPVGSDRRRWGWPEPELEANRPLNYFRSISTYVMICDHISLKVTDRRTDWRTDGRTDGRTDNLPWHNRALRSISRGNKGYNFEISTTALRLNEEPIWHFRCNDTSLRDS